MLKRLIKLSCVLLIVLSASYGAICFMHPVLGKWIIGEAQNLGKPINVSVYADDRVNRDIQVYNTGYKHSYLLALKTFDKEGMLKYIYINLDDKWVGRPVGTAKNDYEIINGSLYQSETGAHFVDFKDDLKGFNFDPKLSSAPNSVTFNVPPGLLKFNNIKIVSNTSR